MPPAPLFCEEAGEAPGLQLRLAAGAFEAEFSASADDVAELQRLSGGGDGLLWLEAEGGEDKGEDGDGDGDGDAGGNGDGNAVGGEGDDRSSDVRGVENGDGSGVHDGDGRGDEGADGPADGGAAAVAPGGFVLPVRAAVGAQRLRGGVLAPLAPDEGGAELRSALAQLSGSLAAPQQLTLCGLVSLRNATAAPVAARVAYGADDPSAALLLDLSPGASAALPLRRAGGAFAAMRVAFRAQGTDLWSQDVALALGALPLAGGGEAGPGGAPDAAWFSFEDPSEEAAGPWALSADKQYVLLGVAGERLLRPFALPVLAAAGAFAVALCPVAAGSPMLRNGGVELENASSRAAAVAFPTGVTLSLPPAHRALLPTALQCAQARGLAGADALGAAAAAVAEPLLARVDAALLRAGHVPLDLAEAPSARLEADGEAFWLAPGLQSGASRFAMGVARLGRLRLSLADDIDAAIAAAGPEAPAPAPADPADAPPNAKTASKTPANSKTTSPPSAIATSPAG